MSRKSLASKEEVLRALADEMSIPEHMDEKARSRYRSIGEWLNRDGSSIKHLDPQVSPQGSFMLGTVVRPVGDSDCYDVDLVCKAGRADPNLLSQADLKAAVGAEIKAYARAHGMKSEPEDGRRCWTLDYADEAAFHMDILPGVGAEPRLRGQLLAAGISMSSAAGLGDAIAITDKLSPTYWVRGGEWGLSNPAGYARWFRRQQAVVLESIRARKMAAGTVYASIEDMPSHQYRTPLQDSIKLLKRHRDTMFDGDEDRPISIIITTLAARAYGGQDTIHATLEAILPHMGALIESRDGTPWIANPSHPLENFADKWSETPRKKELFERWIRQAGRDFGEYLRGSGFNQMPEGLRDRVGASTATKVFARMATAAPLIAAPGVIARAETAKIIAEGGATKPWCA